ALIAIKQTKVLKILLVCGILSALLYIGTDLFLAMRWQAYSYTSQTISELSAIGAPTRSFWIAMTFLFNPLLIAFGIGVWKSAREKRSLRITGVLLSVWGVLGFIWLFFPMHLRGAIGSTTDTMHLVMAGVTVTLMTLFIAIGSGARGRWFRLYSILTILLMLILGSLVGMQAPRVAAQLPTPWLGIMERVSVFSPILWVLVLAIVLLRANKKPNSANNLKNN
ncbi:MAG: DUF998 domain-containing protein, partial [Patescibacteria group bacterium]